MSPECVDTTHSYSLSGLHNTDDIFVVMVQRSRSHTTFAENALFWRRHYDGQFAVSDHV